MADTAAVTRYWALCAAVCAFLGGNHADTLTPAITELQPLPDCGFNCSSGECITAERVCDGAVDCEDKSDEIAATCFNRTTHCPGYAFRCDYGGCVDANVQCNGKTDCADASDEKSCDTPVNNTCKFRCKSGDCLESHKVCDGAVDCPDRSDETVETCSKHTHCPNYAVRCDYGGCVDADARCNGKSDCADDSDEKGCPDATRRCRDAEFQCHNGSCVAGTLRCDGRADCEDGSDETMEQCGAFKCAMYLFRCDYGACIDADGACDGRRQCADGSDESPAVCASTTPRPIPCPPPRTPRNGTVEVRGTTARFNCKAGFSLTGSDVSSCRQGAWTPEPPSCKPDDNSIPGSSSSSVLGPDWRALPVFLVAWAWAATRRA